MSERREQLLEQLDGLSTALTGVLNRLGQIELEMAASRNEANLQISAIRDFLNDPQISALGGPDPAAGAEVSRANEAIQKLSVGETQEQILEIFLEEVNSLSDRAILFLQKGDSYVAWKGLGFDPSVFDSVQAESEEDPIRCSARQQRIIYQTDGLTEAFSWLAGAGAVPAVAVCIPLVFEATAPVVLYADSSQGIELDSLELLSHLAVLMLKNHYLMARLEEGITPDAEAATVSLLSEPEAVPAPIRSPEPDSTDSEAATDYVSLVDSEIDEVEELLPPEVELEVQADASEVAFSLEEGDSGDLVEPPVVEPAEDPAEFAEAKLETSGWSGLFAGPEDEPSEESETDADAVDLASEETDDVPSLGTLLRSDDAASDVLTFESGTAEGEAVEGVSDDEIAGDSRVRSVPEADLEEAPENEAAEPKLELGEESQKHSEARRFARLLVSEIKLYHEDKVKEGREIQDIYGRLQRDIDRSREMYERRADAQVKTTHDYFHEELVRILAEGDEAQLGTGHPGPMLSGSD